MGGYLTFHQLSRVHASTVPHQFIYPIRTHVRKAQQQVISAFSFFEAKFKYQLEILEENDSIFPCHDSTVCLLSRIRARILLMAIVARNGLTTTSSNGGHCFLVWDVG